MRSIKLMITGLALFIAGFAQSQVSVNINLLNPPLWGPAGYTEVRYYYLPDVQAYYDIQTTRFIYYSGGAWVQRPELPWRYRNYDLYGGYKVVLADYRGNTPYTLHKEHKIKYKKGYHGPAQKNIGERPGNRNPEQKINREAGPGKSAGKGDSGGGRKKGRKDRGK